MAFSVYLSLFHLQFSMALIFLPCLYTWGKELVLHFLKDGLKTLSSLHLSYIPCTGNKFMWDKWIQNLTEICNTCSDAIQMCVSGRAEVHSGVSKYRELVGTLFPSEQNLWDKDRYMRVYYPQSSPTQEGLPHFVYTNCNRYTGYAFAKEVSRQVL